MTGVTCRENNRELNTSFILRAAANFQINRVILNMVPKKKKAERFEMHVSGLQRDVHKLLILLKDF